MYQTIFCVEWVHKTFSPQVKEYLKEEQLPLRCLLVMDNSTAHPQDLDDDLTDRFDFIKAKSLTHNTTPLLQPMDKQVISNFKRLYTRAILRRCFEVTNDTQLKLMELWKDHFTILNCLILIDNAWTQVTYIKAWGRIPHEKNLGQTLQQSEILRGTSMMTVLSMMKLCPWEKV